MPLKRVIHKEQLHLIQRKLTKTEKAEEASGMNYSKTEQRMKNDIKLDSKIVSPAFEKRFNFLQEKYRHLPKK